MSSRTEDCNDGKMVERANGEILDPVNERRDWVVRLMDNVRSMMVKRWRRGRGEVKKVVV